MTPSQVLLCLSVIRTKNEKSVVLPILEQGNAGTSCQKVHRRLPARQIDAVCERALQCAIGSSVSPLSHCGYLPLAVIWPVDDRVCCVTNEMSSTHLLHLLCTSRRRKCSTHDQRPRQVIAYIPNAGAVVCTCSTDPSDTLTGKQKLSRHQQVRSSHE